VEVLVRQVLYLTTTHLSDLLRLLAPPEPAKTALRDKVAFSVR
jgi:hypothetical protein